jgi:hypothetical protein
MPIPTLINLARTASALTLAACLCLLPCAAVPRLSAAGSPGVTASAALQAASVVEGGEFTVRIVVDSPAEGEWRIDAPVLSGLKNCGVLSVSVSDDLPVPAPGERYVRTFDYSLKALTPGTASFGPAGIRCHGKEGEGFLSTAGLEIKVLRSPRRLILWIVLLLAAAALAGTGALLLRRFRSPKAAPGRPAVDAEPVAVRPAERRFAEFVEFRKKRASLGAKEYVDGLMKTLRASVIGRFAPGRKGLQDSELPGLLPPGDPLRPRIEDVVSAVSSSRFAGREPAPDEIEALESLIEKFLLERGEPGITGPGSTGGTGR